MKPRPPRICVEPTCRKLFVPAANNVVVCPACTITRVLVPA